MPSLGAGGSEQDGDQRQRTTEGWFSSGVGAVTSSDHPPLIARLLPRPTSLLLNFTLFLGAGNGIFPFLTCQTGSVELSLALL